MASGPSSLSTFNELLECSLCLDFFTQPRILFCGHVFCEQCLIKLMNHHPRVVLKCPTCRNETKLSSAYHIKDLPRHFMASKLSEKIAAESRQKRPPTEILCDICENRDLKVSKRCMDCAMNLCQKCLENHQSLSAFTGHKTTPITKSLFCDIHKGVVVSMFCEDCKVVVCRTCVMKIHGKHTCRDVSIIAQQIRDKLKTAVESTASKQSDSAMLRSLNTMVSKLEYKKEKQIKEMKDLRYYFKDMIARLDRTELEFQSAIDTEIQELVKNEKELIGRSLLARTLMAEKSDIELMLKGQKLEFPKVSRSYTVTEPRVEGNLNKMKRIIKEMVANLTVVKVTSIIEADQAAGAITSQIQQLKVKSTSFQFAVDKSSSAPQNLSPNVCKSPAPDTANLHTVKRTTSGFTSPGGFNVGPFGGSCFGNSLKPKSDDTSASVNKPSKSGFSFGASTSSTSSSASGVFKTGVSDSKKTGGRFKTGGASVKTSDDTSDDNNKSGFGGFTFRQTVPTNFKAALEGASGGGQDSSPDSLQAASELKSGSVMDILGGKKAAPTNTSSTTSGASKSLAALFQKPVSAWEYPTCMVQNKAVTDKCSSRVTAKPKSGSTTSPPTSSNAVVPSGANSLASLFTKQAGSWDCPTCMVQNKAEHSICPACDTPNPKAGNQAAVPAVPQQDIPKPTWRSQAELFKKPTGNWDCDMCTVTNKPEATKCIACEMPKPGMKATTSFTSPGGFYVSPSGRSGFGNSLKPKSNDTSVSENKPPTSGFSFGTSISSSSSSASGVFKTGVTDSKKTDLGRPGNGFKFGGTAIKSSDNTSDNNSKTGFGGLKFGQRNKDSSSDSTAVVKPTTETSPSGPGLTKSGQVSSSDSDKTIVIKPAKAGGFKFGQSVADSTSSNKTEASSTGGFKFGQTISSGPSKPGNVTCSSGAGGFKFGTTIASTLKDNDNSSKTNATKGQIVAAPRFSWVD